MPTTKKQGSAPSKKGPTMHDRLRYLIAQEYGSGFPVDDFLKSVPGSGTYDAEVKQIGTSHQRAYAVWTMRLLRSLEKYDAEWSG